MIESSSIRRALSRVREEISPAPEDKARLRARILGPAALLSAEGAGHELAAQDRAAQTIAARAAVRGAAGQVRQTAVHAASLTPWTALKAAGTLAVAAGLTLLGVGGGLGFWLGHEVASGRAPSLVVAQAPAGPADAALLAGAASVPVNATPAAPSQPAADSVPASMPASDERSGLDRQRTTVPPRAPVARKAGRANSIDDELALLRRVERALRNDDAALARALLRELDQSFPDSRLGEERSAARRIADCRSGEPDARERARAFLREHAASVYRKRIVRACALELGPRENASPAAPMKNAESPDTHLR